MSNYSKPCLKPIRLITEPDTGVTIGEASADAARLALELHVNVEFCHSGRTYEVLFNDLVCQVKPVQPTRAM